jgi:hypothetical protein
MTDTTSTTATAPGRNLSGLRSPAIVAGWVAGILVVIALVRLLFSGLPWAYLGALQTSQQAQGGGLYDLVGPSDFDYFAVAGGEFVSSLFVTIVPFAVGVMLSLWLLLPVPAGMPLVPLVLRGLVASLVGALLATIAQLIAMAGRGYTDPTQIGIALLGFVVLAATSAPVVLLVLVVRTYVPRAARA